MVTTCILCGTNYQLASALIILDHLISTAQVASQHLLTLSLQYTGRAKKSNPLEKI